MSTWSASRALLDARQRARLRGLITGLGDNPFWEPRLKAAGLDPGGSSIDLSTFCARLPTITKAELVAEQAAHPPFGRGLTFPLGRYTRIHQTSGTSGQPLRWLDTESSWSEMLDTWTAVLRAAGIGADDRFLVPFSFGPFLGFWTAFEAAGRLGCLTIPGGGLDSVGRLRLLLASRATAMCCTPTYALRLAEVARSEDVDLGTAAVRSIVVAGEPGGSIAAIRQRIEQAWPGARVFDHHGMTEVGPVTIPNPRIPDVLHVRETSFLAEILDPSGVPVDRGEVGELVLTTLGRLGSPLLRYRTGDLVRESLRGPAALGSVELALEGGVLARADDMIVVRGVNLSPSAVESVIRDVAGDAEYRVTATQGSALVEVEVEIEVASGDPEQRVPRLERAFRDAFQLRVPVLAVAVGSLPRFELKAKRWRRVDT